MADEDVKMGGLEFDIKTNTDDAAKGLDKLAGALERLKRLSTNGVNLAPLSKEVNEFNKAIQPMKTENVQALTQTGKALNTFAKYAKSLKLTELTREFETFSRGMTGMKTAADTAKDAAESLKQLPSRIRSLGTAIEKLTPDRLNNLTLAARRLNNFQESVGNFNIYPVIWQLNDFNRSLDSAYDTMSKLQRYRDLAVQWGESVTNSRIAIPQQTSATLSQPDTPIRRIPQFADTLLDQFQEPQVSPKVEVPSFNEAEMQQTISACDVLVDEFNKIRDALNPDRWYVWGKTMLSTALSVEQMKDELKAAGQYALKFGARIKEAFGSAIASKVKNVTSSLSQFSSSVGRIGMYRAIRFALSQFVSSLQGGTNNLYQWSKALSGDFASAMDSAAASLQYLKNSFAAMISPLVESLTPALDVVIEQVVRLMNVVNQLFASVSGQTVYTRAAKSATEYAAAATKADKATKRFTVSFDEINILGKKSSDSTSTKKVPDYGSMFETAQIESPIADFASQLRAAFTGGDWDTLGTLLGDKLNEIVADVDWTGIGSTLGYYINGLVSTVYSFLTSFDFQTLGADLADSINVALTEIDFEIWGRTLVAKATAAIDLLIGFLTNLDWTEVGKAIGDFATGIFNEAADWLEKQDWKAIGEDIWDGITSILSGLDADSVVSGFLRVLGDGITAAADLISGFVENAIPDLVAGFEELSPSGTAVALLLAGMTAVLAILNPIPTAIGLIVVAGAELISHWDDLKTAASDVWDDIKTTVKNGVDAIKKFVNFEWSLPALKLPHLKWVEGDTKATGVVKTILETLNLPTSIPKLSLEMYANGGVMTKPTLFGMNGSKAMVGGEAGDEAILPLNTFYKKFTSILDDEFASNIDTIGQAVSRASTTLKGVLTKIQGGISTLGDSLDDAKDTTEGLSGAFSETAKAFGSTAKAILAVKEAFNQTVLSIKSFVNTSLSDIENAYNYAGGGLPGLLAGIKVAFEDAFSGIPQIIANVSDAIGSVETAISAVEKVLPVLDSAKSALSGIVLTHPELLVIAGIIAAIVGSLILAWNNSEKFRTSVVNALSVIKTSVEKVFTSAQQAFAPVGDFIQRSLQSIWGVIENIFGFVGDALGQLITWLTPALTVVSDFLSQVFQILGTIAGYVADTLDPIVQGVADVLNVIVGSLRDMWSSVSESLTPAFNAIWQAVHDILGVVTSLLSTLVQSLAPVVSAIASVLSSIFSVVGQLISSVAQALSPVIQTIAQVVGSVLAVVAQIVSVVAQSLSPVIQFIGQILSAIFSVLGDIITSVVQFLQPAIDFVSAAIEGIGDILRGVSNIFIEIINVMISGVEGFVNVWIKGINFVIGALNKFSFDIPDWMPVIGGKKFGFNLTEVSEVTLPRIKTFADGGFPDAGEMFIARENGPELVGTVGGSTAVANNGQIVEGIREGVEAAMRRQNELLRRQNELLQALLEKDTTSEVTVSSMSQAISRKNKRDGKSTIPIGT